MHGRQGRSALTPSLPEQVRPPPPPSRPELFQTPSRPSRPEIQTLSPPSWPELVWTLPPPSLLDLLRSPPPPPPPPLRVATSPTLGSLEAAGFPAWWRSSSPSGSSQGMYPPGGFTSLLQSNNYPENSQLVGNTTNRTTISPTIARTPPADRNAQDKETINVDEDDTVEDGRKKKRLNWTKDEDIILASAWVHNSKDPVD